MILALRKAGYSDIQIAEATGFSQATIFRLRNRDHKQSQLKTWLALNEFHLRVQAERARDGKAGG
jgi:hypothetical protein